MEQTYTLFSGYNFIFKGSLADVALKAQVENALIFEDATGKVVDLDLRGDAAQILARYALKPQVGRPKMGVVAREITLLPRHWEWLASQNGGASVTLRKLIDEARKANIEKDAKRAAIERTHKFMSAMAGDLPNYEEALRQLYAGNRAEFFELIEAWPQDVKSYCEKLLSY